MKCKKCNGQCKPSQALNNSLVSSNDFGNDSNSRGTTQSRLGEAKLVDCEKCTNCGHSFVPNENTDISLHMKWWESLSDDFSNNSKFQQMHCYLNSNKMDGFSSKDGRTLESLNDDEICLIWKNMLCLEAYGTPMSENTEDAIDFITKPENHSIVPLLSQNHKNEKIVIDFFNRKYRGKLADTKESLELAIKLVSDFQEESKSEMYDNMQYYMEYCQKNEYISPKEWIDSKKHF